MSTISGLIHEVIGDVVNSKEKQTISNIILQKNTDLYWQDVVFKIALSGRTQSYWIKRNITFSQFLEYLLPKLEQDFQLQESWELVPYQGQSYTGRFAEMSPNIRTVFENETDPMQEGTPWADLPGSISKWFKFNTYYIRTQACRQHFIDWEECERERRQNGIQCPVCIMTVYNWTQPYTCEHCICPACEEEWSRARAGNPTCPQCRAPQCGAPRSVNVYLGRDAY